jgi:hypothetical protein
MNVSKINLILDVPFTGGSKVVKTWVVVPLDEVSYENQLSHIMQHRYPCLVSLRQY